MNARMERFNRTIQEEFVDYRAVLPLEPERFNEKFMDRLLLYNTKRVHHAFKNKLPPVQYLPEYEVNLPAECRNGWAYSAICDCARRGV